MSRSSEEAKIRRQVVTALIDAGAGLTAWASNAQIALAIERHAGVTRAPDEGTVGFYTRVLEAGIHRARGQVAGPPYRPPFREYKPVPHLRQAEIEAHPTPISMPWDGRSVDYRQQLGQLS